MIPAWLRHEAERADTFLDLLLPPGADRPLIFSGSGALMRPNEPEGSDEARWSCFLLRVGMSQPTDVFYADPYLDGGT